MASGPTAGVTPPRTATAATRPAIAGIPAHASAYGSAAGQAHHPDLVGAEHIGDMGHVAGPVADALIAVFVAESRPRSLHEHDAHAEPLGRAAAHDRELPAAAGRAVEPQHDRTGRIPELGVAQAPAVGKEEAALGAGRLAAGDTRRMTPRIGGLMAES